MPSYTPVIAVLRGLEVLRVINRSGSSTVKDIHYDTGLNKATIVRMLETLMHAGYLRRNEETGAYAVTARVGQLSSGFARFDTAADIAAPLLTKLRDDIGWPASFSVCDEDAMVAVQTSRDVGPISFGRNPGYRIPMFESSLGKVYLAYCSDGERRKIIAKLHRGSRKQALSPSQIETMVKRVRTAGYAITDVAYSNREYKGRFNSVAVPVVDDVGIFGALNIIWLRNALSQEQVRDLYVARMQATARILADQLRAAGFDFVANS